MPIVTNESDPRVQRTRQMLLQAFMELLQEKQSIHSISVLEITQRATVNRATFYAHFEDKYALLEAWMRKKFHHSLEREFPTSSTLRISTLHTLILTVFNFLALFRQYLRPADRQFEPFFEIALQQELYEVILGWLKQVPTKPLVREKTVETTALVVSWAIFGSAAQWSRGERTISAEEMACDVLTVVTAGLSPIVVVS